MELRELIGGQVEAVGSNTTVAEASIQMKEASVGALAVVDNGDFSGILTERDVVGVVAEGADPAVETVAGWMTMYPDSFSPEIDVKEAADWMLAAGYRHLPVVEDGQLIGVASIKDILWALAGEPTG